MRWARGPFRFVAIAVRALLVLVLAITALAAAALWAYSRERTIDTSCSVGPIATSTSLHVVYEWAGFHPEQVRMVCIRGGIHLFLDGRIGLAELPPDELAARGLEATAADPIGYSIGGHLFSIGLAAGRRQVLMEGNPNFPQVKIYRPGSLQVRTRLWLAFLLSATFPIWFLWRRPARMRSRRMRRGLCGACGYNLHGNLSGVCPECGSAVQPARRSFLTERRVTMATCSACGQPVDRSPGGAGGGVCDSCGTTTIMPEARWYSMPEMRYQNLYVWNVLVAALDVMLTMAVIVGHGGYEVNPVAAAVIAHMGIPGAVGLKFGIILLVIIICEVVGRRDDRAGRGLARAALVINSVPVIYTLGLLVIVAAQ